MGDAERHGAALAGGPAAGRGPPGRRRQDHPRPLALRRRGTGTTGERLQRHGRGHHLAGPGTEGAGSPLPRPDRDFQRLVLGNGRNRAHLRHVAGHHHHRPGSRGHAGAHPAGTDGQPHRSLHHPV
ncbi:hypothetical protein AZA_90349 [Nitrospirillum viridazoti Y2]|nr:hypothetical protein AZA_90349 [Nitrospirillum amazonense Y2]